VPLEGVAQSPKTEERALAPNFEKTKILQFGGFFGKKQAQFFDFFYALSWVKLIGSPVAHLAFHISTERSKHNTKQLNEQFS
jgi:hypothetical protein